MDYSSPRQIGVAWAVLATMAGVWLLAMLIAPDEPLNAPLGWNSFTIYLGGILFLVPPAGILILVSIFGILEHILRSRRARTLRDLGIDPNATAASVGPSPLLRRFGWLIVGLSGLGLSIAVVAGLSHLI
jgi:hypothetical protein